MQKTVWGVRVITDDGTGTPVPVTDAARGFLDGEFHGVTGGEAFAPLGTTSPYVTDPVLTETTLTITVDGLTPAIIGAGLDFDITGTWMEGEDITTPQMETWYPFFISKGSLSNPVRSVDIVDGGSFGTNSSFGFALDNTNVDEEAFFEWLKAQGIYLLNRTVVLYAFIQEDDESPWVALRRWSGIVSNDPFTDIEYRFECSGDFPIKSGLYPSRTLSGSEFPGLDTAADNQVLPIVLGHVERAVTRKITSEVLTPVAFTPAGVDSPEGVDVFSTVAVAYRTTDGDRPYLVLWTPRKSFSENEMAGWVLRGVRGADDSVSIVGNDATTTAGNTTGKAVGAGFTVAYLSIEFSSLTEDSFAFQFEEPPVVEIGDTYSRGDALTAENADAYTGFTGRDTFITIGNPATGLATATPDIGNNPQFVQVDPTYLAYEGRGMQAVILNAAIASGRSLSTPNFPDQYYADDIGPGGTFNNYKTLLLGEYGGLALRQGTRVTMLRGTFRPGELVWATDPDDNGWQSTRRRAEVIGDPGFIIGNFDNAGVFVQNKDLATATGVTCYISIVDAGGGNRTLNVYSNAARSDLRATVTYSTPGLKTLTAVGSYTGLYGYTTSFVNGTVLVNSMAVSATISARMYGYARFITNVTVGGANYFDWLIFRLHASNQYMLNDPHAQYRSTPFVIGPPSDEARDDAWRIKAKETCAYWQVFRKSNTYLVSQDEVSEIYRSQRAPSLSVFGDDAYISIDAIISDSAVGVTTTASGAANPFSLPFIQVSQWATADGRLFRVLVPFTPAYVGQSNYALSATNTPMPLLIDRTRTTSASFPLSGGLNAQTGVLTFKAFPPAEMFTHTTSRLFLLVDMDVSGGYPVHIRFGNMRVADKSGVVAFEQVFSVLKNEFTNFEPGALINLLPNSYYDIDGDSNGEASMFSRTFITRTGLPYQVESVFEIPASALVNRGAIFGYGAISLMVAIPPQISVPSASLRIKQIGFVGEVEIDLGRAAAYARVIGEKVPGTVAPVRYIADVFRYFTIHDGYYPDAGSVETNLDSVRSPSSGEPLFPVGRNLLSQRSSKDWITDLCRQAWFCAYPGRDGKPRATNWLVKLGGTLDFSDDDEVIVAGSVSADRSDYKRIYNKFSFRYHYDPGRGQYARVLEVSKASEAVFPLIITSTKPGDDTAKAFTSVIILLDGGTYYADVVSSATGVSVGDIVSLYTGAPDVEFFFAPVVSKTIVTGSTYTYRVDLGPKLPENSSIGVSTSAGIWYKQGSGTPQWTTFVSGLPFTLTAYEIARDQLWAPCHAAYLKTLSMQAAPDNITELSWFVDLGLFYEDPTQQPLDTLAALNTAILHAQWTTKQKDIINYSIPLTLTTAARDLLDYGAVRDYIYTSDEPRAGWVFSIEDDIEADRVNVRTMLSPDGLVIPGLGDIYETGSADDEIDEQGDAADDIDETGEAT